MTIWRTRAEHAAEEAAPLPGADGQALVDALRAQVELMRAWAKDEQQKREAAEDARLEARSEAATLENENAHLRAALNRMRDLGHGMPARWFMREIEDGLNVSALTHER